MTGADVPPIATQCPSSSTYIQFPVEDILVWLTVYAWHSHWQTVYTATKTMYDSLFNRLLMFAEFNSLAVKDKN